MAGNSIENTCESVPKGQHNSKSAIRGAYHSRDVLTSFAWYIMTETRQPMKPTKRKTFRPPRGIYVCDSNGPREQKKNGDS